MKWFSEFGRLIGELVLEADLAIILITAFLIYKQFPVRVIVSAAVVWTTVKWLSDYWLDEYDEFLDTE